MILQFDLIKGLMVGVRHFDPDEYHPYTEVQIFLLVFRINVIFIENQEEE